jgi:hypothetical protein
MAVIRRATVDEFGALDQQIQLLRVRHAELRETILGWHAKAPAGDAIEDRGERFALQISACKSARTIFDPGKAFASLCAAVGLKRAVKLITIPLGKAIDKYVPEQKHRTFVRQQLSGPREIVVVSIARRRGARQ